MRNILILAGIVVLLAGIWYLTTRQSAPPEFAIKNKGDIQQIEMQVVAKGERQEKLVLTKQNDSLWTLNDTWTAVQPKVARLLDVIGSLHMLAPLQEAEQQTALKLIKQNHTEVSIYGSSGLMKKYLVGATNSQQTANYMLLDGNNEPFLVTLPAMEGYVSIYFNTQPMAWREKLLWNLHGNQLKQITVQYGDSLNPDATYSLVRGAATEDWTLSTVGPAEKTRAREYEALFAGKVFAQGIADQDYPTLLDSLQRRDPDVRLTLQPFQQTAIVLCLFVRPDNTDVLFGYIAGRKELYTVQHFVIDKFLKSREWFMQPA